MTLPDVVVIATENRHKSIEMKTILRRFLPESVKITTLSDYSQKVDFPPENGTSFCENAIVKSEVCAKVLGVVSIADDSGLCVQCLDGAPGLRSKRWLGPVSTESRNEGLIHAIEATGSQDWSAEFVCAIAVSGPEMQTFCVTGYCCGTILSSSTGTSGFGYDPIFKPLDHDLTLAQMSAEEKNIISHRAKAIHLAVRHGGWSNK